MGTGNRMDQNYQKILKQAQELDRIASSLRTIANQKMEETLEGIALAWKGENASSYINKGVKLQENLDKSARYLGDIAENIRNTAKNRYDAE